jgi:hypothetical protein
MRKKQIPVKAEPCRKPADKKAYAPPELAKKEKLIRVAGSAPPVVVT